MISKKLFGFIILFFCFFVGLIFVNKETFADTYTPPFTDVSSDHWAVDYISAIKDAGITVGYPDGTFRPEESVTRAQMAAFIIRAIEGEPQQGSYDTDPYFADVDPTHWAFKYVQRVRERNIAHGYPGNLYGPEDDVTREQMAKMLIMGLVSEGEITEPPEDYCSSGSSFPDVEQDRWSCRYIKRLKELGITTGYPDGTYRPEASVTRAEMAAFIYRTFLKDTTSPSVFITSPTSSSGYSTKNSTINLAGLASDDQGLSSITWSNNRGGSGTATGTTEWSISNIPLQPGDNVITITAKDLAGNVATDSITITYNPNLEFLSSPQAIPDTIFINEPTPVIFRIAIEDNPNLDILNVKLLKLDSNNNVIETITTLADDGNIDNGDDIASDGVFSGKAIFTENTEGIIRLRISVDTTAGTAYSEVFTLSVIDHLNDAEISKILSMPNETLQKYNELKTIYGEEEAKTKTVEWLKKQPEIIEAGISESGNGIWYILNSGVLGGILLTPEGMEGNRISVVPKRPIVKQDLDYKSNKNLSAITGMLKALCSSTSKPTIGSKNVLIMAPFHWQWKKWGTAFEDKVYDIFSNSTCPTFKVTKIYDMNANVEAFKKLNNYGVIILHTHGDTVFKFNFKLPFLLKLNCEVVLLTAETVTNTNITTYEADLKMGRLANIDGYYAITPDFIKYYNKSFPDSLIYVGACRSIFNHSMASAFIGNGAKTYVGFSNIVLSKYDYNIALTFFDSLVNKGKTTGEAFDKAISQHGSNDGVFPYAYFKIVGSKDLVLTEEGIINGSFEEGNINGWSGQGDVRVISHLGSLSPQDGVYMGIISTGLGAINDSDSFIEQAFCIPKGVTTLSFDYNVVSEEPMEWVGTEYDDRFEVTLTTSNETTIIAYESVNTSLWIPVSGIDFYGGDDTTYMTGWKHITYNVSGLNGEKVVLRFHVQDKGDSIYDTAVLIDNIKLE